MHFLTNKKFHIIFLLFILGFAVWFSDSNHELRKRIQYLTFDVFNRFHERPATDDIAIIDVDETSLKEIGQWPWPRTVMADIVDRLDAMGAKSIAFDMVFAEEDRTSPQQIVKYLPEDESFSQAKENILNLPNNEKIFANSIQAAGNVVTGFAAARPEETRRLPYRKNAPTLFFKNKEPLLKEPFSPIGLATNLEILSSSAAGNGSFIATPHVDGIIREVSLFNAYPHYAEAPEQTKLYPMLGLEAWRVSLSPNARYSIKKRKDKNKGLFDTDYYIKLGKTEIPVNTDLKLWVHYRDIKSDEYIKAVDVLKDEDVRNKITDKIVFIGTSAVGLRDIRSTPLSIFEPGVEVHVNVVEQILQNKFLTRPSFTNGVEAIIILVSGLVIILLAPFINAIWLGVFSIVSVVGLYYSAFFAYVEKGLLFDPTYPGAVIFFLFVVSSLLSYLRSEADKRQVKTAFGHYISPEFMEELTNSPDKLKLGGEVRDLTVMFSDIRSFTKISENLSPEELIQLMNDFLTPMSDIVMNSRGTIDKYMGDAMMAFWNAPLDDPDHARQACLAALKMNEALVSVNEKMKEKNKDALNLQAGIGINTGPCSVGNMGSKQRFAYSALGDAVNLASRLEGQTKSYGVDILIGEDTKKQVDDLAMLELDLIKVIGRDEAVRVYTLVGDVDYAQSAEFKKWKAAHNGMLAAYRIADLSCAAQDCKEASDLALDSMKKYYKIYSERIIELTKNPPPENWDGVFVAKSK